MKLLTPYKYIDSVTDLTAGELEQADISHLLIDLDDTLVASFAQTIDPTIVSWLEKIQQDGIQIVLLSNGGSKHVAGWAEQLALDAIALSGKPLPIAFARGLKKLSVTKSSCAMLGDQLFTDVLGANIYGLKSILVKPLSAGKPHTKLLRNVENFYFATTGQFESK